MNGSLCDCPRRSPDGSRLVRYVLRVINRDHPTFESLVYVLTHIHEEDHEQSCRLFKLAIEACKRRAWCPQPGDQLPDTIDGEVLDIPLA